MFTGKRPSPGEHLIEDHAERPQVRASIRGSPAHLLRCHIGGCPQPGVRGGEALVAGLRETEVENLHRAILQDHYVARFEITMHDARGVCARQSFDDLLRDRQCVVDGQ